MRHRKHFLEAIWFFFCCVFDWMTVLNFTYRKKESKGERTEHQKWAATIISKNSLLCPLFYPFDVDRESRTIVCWSLQNSSPFSTTATTTILPTHRIFFSTSDLTKNTSYNAYYYSLLMHHPPPSFRPSHLFCQIHRTGSRHSNTGYSRLPLFAVMTFGSSRVYATSHHSCSTSSDRSGKGDVCLFSGFESERRFRVSLRGAIFSMMTLTPLSFSTIETCFAQSGVTSLDVSAAWLQKRDSSWNLDEWRDRDTYKSLTRNEKERSRSPSSCIFRGNKIRRIHTLLTNTREMKEHQPIFRIEHSQQQQQQVRVRHHRSDKGTIIFTSMEHLTFTEPWSSKAGTGMDLRLHLISRLHEAVKGSLATYLSIRTYFGRRQVSPSCRCYILKSARTFMYPHGNSCEVCKTSIAPPIGTVT